MVGRRRGSHGGGRRSSGGRGRSAGQGTPAIQAYARDIAEGFLVMHFQACLRQVLGSFAVHIVVLPIGQVLGLVDVPIAQVVGVHDEQVVGSWSARR